MFDKIKSDFRAVFEMDPAATSRMEVIFTYAGFHAILMHRVAHWLHKMGMPFFARVVSQAARFFTGIEIHPAAKIAGSFFIDHGMGVVIGETTEIGEHVTLFQGVTLGGTGKERGKRHPTLGNHVVIGTGAKVLGGITVGDHVKVGANAVVLSSVPPHSTVVGVPGRIVRVHGRRTMDESMLDHVHMPDPLNEALTRMQRQINALEQKLEPSGGKAAGGERAAGERAGGERAGAAAGHGQKRRQRKPASGGHAHGGLPVVDMPVETVQERQARMARMEKQERMKDLAIKKVRDRAAMPEGEGAAPKEQQEQPVHKKRPRRRRRSFKGQPGQTAPGAAEGGSVQASPSEERPEPVEAGVPQAGSGQE